MITVVTDDAAMRSIFGLGGQADHLLVNAAGKIFINCATISPAVHIEVEKGARSAGAQSLEACMASSITQARQGTLYLMVGGDEAVFKKVEPILRDMSTALRHVGRTGEAAKVKALVNMVNEHQYRRSRRRARPGRGARSQSDYAARNFFSDRSQLARAGDRWRRYAKPRALVFLSAAHAAKDSGIALALARAEGLNLPLAEATKAQYDRMIAADLGELDKSGIAELTFRGRGKKS